jgi:hypothetical protein
VHEPIENQGVNTLGARNARGSEPRITVTLNAKGYDKLTQHATKYREDLDVAEGGDPKALFLEKMAVTVALALAVPAEFFDKAQPVALKTLKLEKVEIILDRAVEEGFEGKVKAGGDDGGDDAENAVPTPGYRFAQNDEELLEAAEEFAAGRNGAPNAAYVVTDGDFRTLESLTPAHASGDPPAWVDTPPGWYGQLTFEHLLEPHLAHGGTFKGAARFEFLMCDRYSAAHFMSPLKGSSRMCNLLVSLATARAGFNPADADAADKCENLSMELLRPRPPHALRNVSLSARHQTAALVAEMRIRGTLSLGQNSGVAATLIADRFVKVVAVHSCLAKLLVPMPAPDEGVSLLNQLFRELKVVEACKTPLLSKCCDLTHKL